jgi:Putative prokaryotic signal transducing protein
MNPTKLLVVEKYASEVQAQAAQAWLEQLGIESFLEGSVSSATLANYGLGPVKLLVTEDSFEAAKNTLDQFRQRPIDLPPWQCGKCREKNEASFDICWNCQRPRDELVAATHAASTSESFTPDIGEADVDADVGNPNRLISKQEPAVGEDKIPAQGEDLIQRGFRSAILGFCLPFLFSPYSVFLLLSSYDDTTGLTSRSLRYRNLAWLINAVTIGAWAVLLIRLLRQ